MTNQVRPLARRGVYRLLTFDAFIAICVALSIAILVGLVSLGALPAWAPVAVCAAVAIAAENLAIDFTDQTGVSVGFAAVVSGIVSVAPEAAPLAGLLVGSMGGLYLPLLRRRRFDLAAFNASSMALAGVAAGSAYYCVSLAAESTAILIPVGGLVATATYWVTNSALVATGRKLREQPREERVFREVLGSDLWLMPPCIALGLLAAGLWHLDLGWLSLVVLVVMLGVPGMRHPRGATPLRLCLAIGVLAVGTAVAFILLLSLESLPSELTLLALVAIAVIADNLAVLFPNDTRLGGSIAAVVAAVVLFAEGDSALLGPLIVGSSGVLVTHVRSRQWAAATFNVSNHGIAALVAAATVAIASIGTDWYELIISGLLAAAIYWVANNLLTAAAIAIDSQRVCWREVLHLLRVGPLLMVLVAVAIAGGTVARVFSEGTGLLIVGLAAIAMPLLAGRRFPRQRSIRGIQGTGDELAREIALGITLAALMESQQADRRVETDH